MRSTSLSALVQAERARVCIAAVCSSAATRDNNDNSVRERVRACVRARDESRRKIYSDRRRRVVMISFDVSPTREKDGVRRLLGTGAGARFRGARGKSQ